MRTKLVVVALVLLLTVGGGGWFYWATQQVPDFYAEVLATETRAATVQRREAAKQFVQRTLRIVEDVEFSDRWSEEFREDQINAWLAEELQQRYPELVPAGVSNPRVRIGERRIHVGFHYDDESWSGVVSVTLRPWVPEPNRLAVEFESIRAGIVPMPLDELLQEAAKDLSREGWRLEWTRRNGHDVAIVHLNGNRPDGAVLETLSVEPGVVRVSGQGADKDGRSGQPVFQVSRRDVR